MSHILCHVLVQVYICTGAAEPLSPEDQLQRMRKKVYALSSEVAHLTRERDILRVQIGQPPGPTLPAGRSVTSMSGL